MYYRSYNNQQQAPGVRHRAPFTNDYNRDFNFYDFPSRPLQNQNQHYQSHPPTHFQQQQQHSQQNRGGTNRKANYPNHQNQGQNHKEKKERANFNVNPNPNPTHDDYKSYLCPGCFMHYDCFSRNNKYVGRVPLILNCHHTLCQECIYRGALEDDIKCAKCRKTSELPRKHLVDNLQEAFTPNYHLFGLIMWTRPHGANYKSPLLVPTQVTLAKRKLNSVEDQATAAAETGEKCCFMSCEKVASLCCKDCNDVYCTACSTAVHKSAKSMWRHTPTPITKDRFSAELPKCQSHPSMDVEFFCKTCETGACCYCFLEKHEGHDRDSLSKLSDEEMSEFHIYRNKAEGILKRLMISQKKLKNICSNSTSSLERSVYGYFVDLHAQIYAIEKGLQKQMSNLSLEGVGKTDSGLDSIGSTMEKSINSLKYLLVAAESIHNKKVNLRSLLEKLRNVQGMPCYLLTEDGDNADPVEFKVDPVLQNIEELFKIQQLDNCKYNLVTGDELPPNYVPDPTETDVDSCISSLLQSCKTEDAVQPNIKLSPPTAPSVASKKPFKPFRRDGKQMIGSHLDLPLENEMVEVTHIESLECFYVQLKKNQVRVMQMNKDIENYIRLGASSVDKPEINELYLALYTNKKEKLWCRGRVTDVNDNRGFTTYEVFLIDYGSTQMLSKDKLREITPGLAQRKPFAIQCELYNPTYANWGKNAHVYMGKIINGKEVFMLVKNITSGVYEVDLLVSSSDKGLTSIIDILIHTCTNALSSSSETSSVSSIRKETFVPECKIFSNSMKFRKHQMEMVMLANVVDPHHIFVHVASHVEGHKKMVHQMKEFYKNSRYESCIPIEGTFVAVEHKDPIRGNWHRALVKKVDMSSSKAHVLLVDWGNNVVVPWSNIRILQQQFTRLETPVVLVKLADVEPYEKEQQWSEKAMYFLQKNFRSQELLKMMVACVDPLEVALFEPAGMVDLCINAQLVAENLADSTGKISRTVEWPQNENGQPDFGEDDGLVATLLKKVDDIVDDDSDEEFTVTSLVKQQIDVVKVDSPDKIFIKFLHCEDQELKLHKELQIIYQKERQPKEKWEEEEECVVIFNDAYVRGKILEKVGDKYKINVYDKATETILPVERIFIYSDYFRKYTNILFKSYLANIRPAGGEKWSLMSIEALERIFDKHKDIYATKVRGDTSKKSIPMLMWYTQVEVAGALEPSVTKFVSINNLLVKMGFAYKKKESEDSQAEPEQNDNKVELTVEAIVHTNDSKSDRSLDDSVASSGGEKTIEREEENKIEVDEATETSSAAKQADTSPSIDWNEIIEKEELEMRKASKESDAEQEVVTDWKPPFPITKREFNAWITCAETDGIIFLRDEDLQTVYKDMETNMKEYFDEKPPSKENIEWRPGQICTISYNNNWYRGKILKVNNPKEIEVLMIDFGSDHVLSPKQLYRELLYPEIPAFASRVKLNDVFPKSGAWLSSDYDMLMEKITEYGKVVIHGPIDVELPLAEIYTQDGQNLNQIIVNQCPNLSRCVKPATDKADDDSVLIESEESLEHIDTTGMEFKISPLPKEMFEEKSVMNIAGVLAYNKVALKEPNESMDDLCELSQKIQDNYPTQPVLEEYKLGTPCICPFAEDGVWYRARIHNVEGLDCGYVFVFYVDFGNVESVSVSDLRMMRPEWFDLPVSCHVAEVNIDLKTGNHLEHVYQHMKKLLGKNKLVEVVSGDPLTVNLYDAGGELCYESLVKKGLLLVK